MIKKYLYKNLVTLCIAIFCCTNLSAQDPNFSQYFSTPLSINPALAGNSDANWRLMGLQRSQWIGQGVEPLTTTSVSLDGVLIRQHSNPKNYIGGGVLFLQDKGMGGIYKSSSFNFAVSSHISLDADDVHSISGGIGGTYSNTLINFSALTFDAQLSSIGFNRSLPTFEANLSNIKPYFSTFAGLMYTFRTDNANFDIGVSGYRFVKTNKTLLKDATQFDPPRYNIHANYQTFLNESITFNTNLLMVVQNNKSLYTAGISAGIIPGSYNPDEGNPFVLYGGLWYRQSEALIPYIGMSYGVLQLGLSYDINASPSKNYLGPLNTFEFSLVIKSPQRSNSPIPCPWK